jgi:hypothetical protein
MYKLDGELGGKSLTPQEEADSVKILLREINKRDRVYEAVAKKLGN